MDRRESDRSRTVELNEVPQLEFEFKRDQFAQDKLHGRAGNGNLRAGDWRPKSPKWRLNAVSRDRNVRKFSPKSLKYLESQRVLLETCNYRERMVGATGIEPVTPTMSR
jgi:hypothetical protein